MDRKRNEPKNKLRSKLILAAIVFGGLYGFAVFLNSLEIRKIFGAFHQLYRYRLPLLFFVFAGTIANLLGFITLKNILNLIAVMLYCLGIVFMGRYVILFGMTGMLAEMASYFAGYILPVILLVLLSIAGLIRQHRTGNAK